MLCMGEGYVSETTQRRRHDDDDTTTTTTDGPLPVSTAALCSPCVHLT